jgi:hypothetical protein
MNHWKPYPNQSETKWFHLLTVNKTIDAVLTATKISTP